MQTEIRLRALIFALAAVVLVSILAASWVRAQKPGHGATWLRSAGHNTAGPPKKHQKEEK